MIRLNDKRSIILTDNSEKVQTLSPDMVEDLYAIAKPKISELADKEGYNLLIFPICIGETKDQIGDSKILDIDIEAEKYIIKTSNIMGFVGRNDTTIGITSRFTNDKQDFFLHYMLQKVLHINLFDLKYQSQNDSIFDFLIYLFPTLLKQAMRQGLYKEYQHCQYNDMNIRGRIDVNRHIRNNIPPNGKIAYTTREYKYDNRITQLIRHTIEHIKERSDIYDIIFGGEELKECVNQICQATTSYKRSDRQRVVHDNIKPVNHPYFTEYLPLQKLCMQILRFEELKYGANENEIYGILFDGAWLWEEYLNTVLEEMGFTHPRNKTKENPLYLSKGSNWQPRYPDFYRDDIVLDAKYKFFPDETHSTNRDDVNQLVTYMFMLKAQYGGFIYPKEVAENIEDSKPRMLCGYGGTMYFHSMGIAKETNDYQTFCAMQKENENILREAVQKYYTYENMQ